MIFFFSFFVLHKYIDFQLLNKCQHLINIKEYSSKTDLRSIKVINIKIVSGVKAKNFDEFGNLPDFGEYGYIDTHFLQI